MATKSQTHKLNIIKTVFIYNFMVYDTTMTVLLQYDTLMGSITR